MSDTKTSAEPSSAPAAAKSGSKRQAATKKKNPTREKARSMFDASAGSLSVEKFFSDFVEKKRNNVELTFDHTSVGRIAQPYVAKARDHAVHRLHQPPESEDFQSHTFALISFTMIRKMLLAVPSSEKFEMGRFKTIADVEWFAPKSVIAAVDNIGKFEQDDMVARLKYNSQDIFRLMMDTAKVMDRHSDYHEKYASPVQGLPWDEIDTSKLVITSEASARWIRDKAKEYLNRAMEHTWTVTITGTDPDPDDEDNEIPWQQQIQVTYPHLVISDNPDKQLRNVLDWVVKLNARMPHIQTVIAAGFATCWRLIYFQRIGHLLRNIERGLPAWFDMRPYDMLTTLGLHHCEISTDDYDGDGYVGFVHEIHRRLITLRSDFNHFLELAKQPDTAFGTVAQLLTYDSEKDYVDKDVIGIDGMIIGALKSDSQAECMYKLKNKGQVVAGLIFGFTKKVEMINNYLGRVNGNPNTLRDNYLKSDFKNY
jgi:hypothetical protein